MVKMDKEQLKSLEDEIKNCKEQIKQLKPQISCNSNLARVYNKLLVKKAVLKKQYKMLKHRPTLKEKIKKLLTVHKKKTLICDYFTTSEA